MTTKESTSGACARGGLSQRSSRVTGSPSVSLTFQTQVTRDAYDVTANPKGYVDLGMAENKVCEDIMMQKLQSLPSDADVRESLYYPDYQGTGAFRGALATFISREFKSIHAIDDSQLVVMNGCEAVLECLAHALCDECEYLMTSSPCYYRLAPNASERAGVKVIQVPLNKQDDQGSKRPYQLDIDALEEALKEAKDQGRVVRGFILVNPHNPLGNVCSREEITDLLNFCARHALHVICDEIYALSVHDPSVTFTSALSVPHPDPARMHFLWGFSKDFGLSGYRCGVLWTKNSELVEYMTSMGVYHSTPTLIQLRLTHLISDMEWLHNTFFPEVKSRLRENFLLAKTTLEKVGASVHPAQGGIFVWADFSMFLTEKTKEAAEDLFLRLFSGRVFILPGRMCGGGAAGSFRIVTAVDKYVLKEGLRRITRVLNELSHSN